MSLPALRASSMIVKMQCPRDEAWFMGVSDMVRLVSPRNNCITSPGEHGKILNILWGLMFVRYACVVKLDPAWLMSYCMTLESHHGSPD